MRTCPACAAANGDDVHYCQACGASFADAVPKPKPTPTLGDLVLLETFVDEPSAQIALAHLQACGIEAALVTDDCGGMIPTLQTGKGIRLFVSPDEVPTARDLLSALPDSEPPPAPPGQNN